MIHTQRYVCTLLGGWKDEPLFVPYLDSADLWAVLKIRKLDMSLRFKQILF